MTACNPRPRSPRWWGRTPSCPASTAPNGPTATSTVPRRPPRSRRWRPGWTSSCRGTRACIEAPATSPGAPPPPTRRHATARSASPGGPPAAATTWWCSSATRPRRSTTSPTASASVPDDVVVTTVVEHHANLLPWARVATRRWVECGTEGTFGVDDVVRVLDDGPRPALLALTAASNVTGWLPPVEEICAAAHARGVPVLVDAAQLAPHRPLPAGPDFVAFSGHKLYAPFGAGALIGPRETFEYGRPVPGRRRRRRPGRPRRGHLDRAPRARGGRVRRTWSAPSPSARPWTSWSASAGTRCGRTRRRCAPGSTRGCARSRASGCSGPALDDAAARGGEDRLAVAAFTVDGMHHALVAARLSAEFGVGVRHGCFCAHPYLIRLLGVGARRPGRGAGGGAARRPQRDPRRGAGQLRPRHVERRRRRVARRRWRRSPRGRRRR